MPHSFRHKNIRLQPANYLGRRLYFLTLCFSHRRHLGANPRISRWLIERLRSHAAKCGFLVHAYCVMPDHMHLLAQGENTASHMMQFIESFKKETGFLFNARAGKPLWQFKYYDHVVRAGIGADRIAWYIWMNPVRKALSPTPQDYPFSGSPTEIGAAIFYRPAPQNWTPPWKPEAP